MQFHSVFVYSASDYCSKCAYSKSLSVNGVKIFRLFSYGIANSAYRSLQDQNENQCVCIVGENGSGKTESARIILHFLSNVHSEHTLSGKQIFHNQNSTRLMRCKSLASYPKYESTESTTPACNRSAGRRDSIKHAHKSHVGQYE